MYEYFLDRFKRDLLAEREQRRLPDHRQPINERHDTQQEALPDIRHGRNFEVTIPGLSLKIGYFTQVTGFSAQLDVLEYPEGGINDYVHRLPTRIKQGNITLKRGVTGEAGPDGVVHRRPSSRPTRRTCPWGCTTHSAS